MCTAKVAQTMRYYDAVKLMRRTPFVMAEEKQIEAGPARLERPARLGNLPALGI